MLTMSAGRDEMLRCREDVDDVEMLRCCSGMKRPGISMAWAIIRFTTR